jgi:hypothetical protein
MILALLVVRCYREMWFMKNEIKWLAYTPDGCWDGNTDPAVWLHFQTDRNVLALITGDGNRQVPGLWKELCGTGK